MTLAGRGLSPPPGAGEGQEGSGAVSVLRHQAAACGDGRV